MPHIAKARDLIKEGRIGKVCKVHLTWNRNTDRVKKTPLNIDPKTVDWKSFLGDAPVQPFDEYRFRNWRWFWDFGGGVFTDLHGAVTAFGGHAIATNASLADKARTLLRCSI